jgi:hypothetical protein
VDVSPSAGDQPAPAARTLPLDRKDIADHTDPAESRERNEPEEPTENTDRNEATEPMDRAEPTEPIDRTEPLDAMDNNESSDQSDQRDPEALAPGPLEPEPLLCVIAPSWAGRAHHRG